MLDDLPCFCQINVDTTFDIVPGLWLTDTSYKHLGLVDENGSNPEFPGSMMLHFNKDRKEFRSFAMEIAVQRPELSECIRKIGHNLNKATALGFKDLFKDAQHMWCTQHLQSRTSRKLKDMHVLQRLQNKIMADLYGTQEAFFEEQGLADPEDGDNFHSKVSFISIITTYI